MLCCSQALMPAVLQRHRVLQFGRTPAQLRSQPCLLFVSCVAICGAAALQPAMHSNCRPNCLPPPLRGGPARAAAAAGPARGADGGGEGGGAAQGGGGSCGRALRAPNGAWLHVGLGGSATRSQQPPHGCTSSCIPLPPLQAKAEEERRRKLPVKPVEGGAACRAACWAGSVAPMDEAAWLLMV